MEMVDMAIRKFWFSRPKSRSVNIFPASKSWMTFDTDFLFRKNVIPGFFDMYLMIFDIRSQYFVRFNQYLVKINQY